MVKVIVNNGQYRITIPKDLVTEREWKAGTTLRFVEDVDGTIYLKQYGKNKK